LASPLQNPAAATDLISFLKALPDCRMRRGIRFPQWWMLLVAIMAILSGQGSLMGMERFAKRHRKTLNELLGTHVAKPPSDSTFRLLLAQLDSLDPSLEADHFSIRIDGGEVLSVGLGPDQGSEPQVDTFTLFGVASDVQDFKDTLTFGGEDFFFCGTGGADWYDHVYDLSQLEALQTIPHTGSTLTLDFLGVQNSGGENESFGIDQIQLIVIPPSGTVISIF